MILFLIIFLCLASPAAADFNYGSGFNEGQIPAAKVSPLTDDFNGNLSGSDITVQQALDTLDDMNTDGLLGSSVDISSETNLIATSPVTLTGDTLSLTLAEDSVLVGTPATAKVLPSCSNATTSKLLYNSTSNAFSCGTDQNSGDITAVGDVASGAAFNGTAGTTLTFNDTVDQTLLYNVTADKFEFSDNVSIVSTGVDLSASNGILTMLGLGTGADESLSIDLNTTSNIVDITSNTAVGAIDWNGMVLRTDNGDASRPAYTFIADTTTGMFRNAGGDNSITTKGLERWNINYDATQSTFIGTVPKVECGETPAIVGNDSGGHVTAGTSVGGQCCTITFNTRWDEQPYCVATSVGAGDGWMWVQNESTSSVDFCIDNNIGDISGRIFNYHCTAFVSPAG